MGDNIFEAIFTPLPDFPERFLTNWRGAIPSMMAHVPFWFERALFCNIFSCRMLLKSDLLNAYLSFRSGEASDRGIWGKRSLKQDDNIHNMFRFQTSTTPPKRSVSALMEMVLTIFPVYSTCIRLISSLVTSPVVTATKLVVWRNTSYFLNWDTGFEIFFNSSHCRFPSISVITFLLVYNVKHCFGVLRQLSRHYMFYADDVFISPSV